MNEKLQEEGPNFLYTSAHLEDLEELKKHYDSLTTHHWNDLDERHPIAARSNLTWPKDCDDDGWYDIEHLLQPTDECISDSNRDQLHYLESKNSKLLPRLFDSKKSKQEVLAKVGTMYKELIPQKSKSVSLLLNQVIAAESCIQKKSYRMDS